MIGKTLKTACPIFILFLFVVGCGTRILPPNEMAKIAPEPVPDNTGKYLCPWTSDDTLAEWVDKALAASLGARIGKFGGQKAGEKVVGAVPIIGGWLGGKIGDAAGRAAAIELSGGWDAMRAGTDQSFNSKDDLAVWMYVHHSRDENYGKILNHVINIYPEMKKGYLKALQHASKR